MNMLVVGLIVFLVIIIILYFAISTGETVPIEYTAVEFGAPIDGVDGVDEIDVDEINEIDEVDVDDTDSLDTIDPVPGKWSKWSRCSQICNGGTQTRTCDGDVCVGRDSRPCNTWACMAGPGIKRDWKIIRKKRPMLPKITSYVKKPFLGCVRLCKKNEDCRGFTYLIPKSKIPKVIMSGGRCALFHGSPINESNLRTMTVLDGTTFIKK